MGMANTIDSNKVVLNQRIWLNDKGKLFYSSSLRLFNIACHNPISIWKARDFFLWFPVNLHRAHFLFLLFDMYLMPFFICKMIANVFQRKYKWKYSINFLIIEEDECLNVKYQLMITVFRLVFLPIFQKDVESLYRIAPHCI